MIYYKGNAMNKKNNRITTLQTITILSILGLFFLPLPSASRTTTRSAAHQQTIIQSTQKEAVSELDATENEEEDDEQTEPTKIIIPSTKKAKNTVAAASSWVLIYNLLPQIFIQSFSTGSDAGIGAFTKMLTKQLIQRQAFKSTKNELLNSIEDAFKQENIIASQEDKLTLLKEQFSKSKINFDQMEQQTSASFILGNSASAALIYTASAMMGSLMKIGLTIALQLMVPQTK
jgi:hypothetical protein